MPAAPPPPASTAPARWVAVGLGVFFLGIAITVDPIGSSPDSGLLDLGHNGTRGLIGLFGGVLLVGALVRPR